MRVRKRLVSFWICSFVFSVIPLWVTAFSSGKIPGQLYFSLLPSVFFICLFLFLSIYRHREFHIVIVVFFAVLFFRYVVVPYLFVFSDSDYLYLIRAVDQNFIPFAFFLMCLEIFGSILICAYFLNRWHGGFSRNEGFKKPDWTLFLFLFSLIFLILVDVGSLFRYQPFFSPGTVFVKEDEYSGNAISAIAADLFMVVAPILIVMSLATKHNAESTLFPYFLSILIVLFFISFFKGVSRFSLLIPALAWLSVLMVAFPAHRIKTRNGVLSYAFIAMFVLTLYKSFGYVEGEVSSDFSIEKLALMGNAYFSNLYNMVYALEVSSNIGLPESFLYLFNDSIANIVFLSKYSDPSLLSVNSFNYHIYGIPGKVDQIIPMTGQGLIYFGLIFSTFWVFLSTVLMVYFSIKAQNESSLGLVFVYSYFALYLSMSMMLSLNSIYPKFINFCFPLIVIFWAHKRISVNIGSLK